MADRRISHPVMAHQQMLSLPQLPGVIQKFVATLIDAAGRLRGKSVGHRVSQPWVLFLVYATYHLCGVGQDI